MSGLGQGSFFIGFVVTSLGIFFRRGRTAKENVSSYLFLLFGSAYFFVDCKQSTWGRPSTRS